MGLVSTSILFFFPRTIASLFANAQDLRLLDLSTHAIRIFCFAYVFRWLAVMTQSFLSAVQKPAQATIMSVGTAMVFPILLLGALWNYGLDGIWFNFVGVNGLAAIVAVVLLAQLAQEIQTRQFEKR